MTATRNRQQIKEYDQHRKKVEPHDEVCPFCELDADSPQTIKITDHFKLVRNIFPYSIWDNRPVADHLLLIPKLHTDTLADLPDKADVEFVKLISEYESQGYNMYARAPGERMKSVAHQHTHLIKTKDRFIRFLLYSAKPYFRWVIK